MSAPAAHAPTRPPGVGSVPPVQPGASKQVAVSKAGLPKGRTCAARTRTGKPCGRARGWGTPHPGFGHCKNHGGCSPSGIKAAAKEAAEFEAAQMNVGRGMGGLSDVEPTEALLYCVQRTAGMASYFRRKVDGLADADEVSGGELAPWARLEVEATDRLARYCKMALDAGVAERRVRLAERMGALIAEAIERALASIQLPPAQRAKLARAVQTELALLEAGTVDGTAIEEAA